MKYHSLLLNASHMVRPQWKSSTKRQGFKKMWKMGVINVSQSFIWKNLAKSLAYRKPHWWLTTSELIRTINLDGSGIVTPESSMIVWSVKQIYDSLTRNLEMRFSYCRRLTRLIDIFLVRTHYVQRSTSHYGSVLILEIFNVLIWS